MMNTAEYSSYPNENEVLLQDGLEVTVLAVNTEYIIAKDSNFFIYTNQYHKFVNMYKDSYQHGGISLDEIIVSLNQKMNKTKIYLIIKDFCIWNKHGLIVIEITSPHRHT